MSAPAIPQAWPALLTREQLRAYLGGMAESTLIGILTVPAVDLGVNLLRWRRREIDAWLDTLPPRLLRAQQGSQSTPPPIPADAGDEADDRPGAALERARARAMGRGSRVDHSARPARQAG